MTRQEQLNRREGTTHPEEPRRGGSSRLRTAIIGFGISGRVFHAPLIEGDESYALEAIVTSNPERAAAVRKAYPRARVLASPEELFSRIDKGSLALELVVIGTPPVTHKTLAKAALERRLHVVVDKPFVPKSEEGRS